MSLWKAFYLCKGSYNPDWVSSLHLGHSKNISGEKLETTLDAAWKREGRARNLDQSVLKIDEAGSEIQDIVFDFDVDETNEEETGMATQTEESQYLFVSEREEPFDDRQQQSEFLHWFAWIRRYDNSRHVNKKSMTLSIFQEFVMNIMKLKLNMPKQDLAYRFNISRS